MSFLVAFVRQRRQHEHCPSSPRRQRCDRWCHSGHRFGQIQERRLYPQVQVRHFGVRRYTAAFFELLEGSTHLKNKSGGKAPHSTALLFGGAAHRRQPQQRNLAVSRAVKSLRDSSAYRLPRREEDSGEKIIDHPLTARAIYGFASGFPTRCDRQFDIPWQVVYFLEDSQGHLCSYFNGAKSHVESKLRVRWFSL